MTRQSTSWLRRMSLCFALCATLLMLNACAEFSIAKTEVKSPRTDDICLFWNEQFCQKGDIACLVNSRNYFCLCKRKTNPELAKEVCAQD